MPMAQSSAKPKAWTNLFSCAYCLGFRVSHHTGVMITNPRLSRVGRALNIVSSNFVISRSRSWNCALTDSLTFCMYLDGQSKEIIGDDLSLQGWKSLETLQFPPESRWSPGPRFGTFTVRKLYHSGLELQKLAFALCVILHKFVRSLMGEVGFVTQSSTKRPGLYSYDDVISSSCPSIHSGEAQLVEFR